MEVAVDVGKRVEILKGESRQPRRGRSPIVSLVGKRGTVIERNGSGHSHLIRMDPILFPGDTDVSVGVKWFMNEDFRQLNVLDEIAEKL
jgi:hypothetical protein